MKRIIAVCVVFLFAAGGVFSQELKDDISVRAGVLMDAVASVQRIKYNHEPADGNEPLSNPIWVGGFGREDGTRTKLTLSFTASYLDKAGLYTDISFMPWWRDNRDQDLLINLGSIELGQLGGWLRPVSWLTVHGGRFELQKLRGRIDGYNWRNNSMMGAKAGGFDSVFTEFDGANAVAVEIDGPLQNLVPALKGLYFGAMIYNLEEFGVANNQGVYGGYTEAKYMPENMQFALGYEIEDIGLARVQYIGTHHVSNVRNASAIGVFSKLSADDNVGPRMQLAFTFDSSKVPNLIAEIGGTLSFKVTDPTSLIPGLNSDGHIPYEVPLQSLGEYQEPHRIAGAVQYGFSDLGLHGLMARVGGEYNFGGYYHPQGSGKFDTASLTKIWFATSYSFNNSFKVLADVGVNIHGNEMAYERVSKKGGSQAGFGIYGQYTAFGNTFLRLGVVYSGGYKLGETPVDAYKLDDILSFPIHFHFEF